MGKRAAEGTSSRISNAVYNIMTFKQLTAAISGIRCETGIVYFTPRRPDSKLDNGLLNCSELLSFAAIMVKVAIGDS